MGFVQITEFRTAKIEEMRELADEWEAASAPSRTARRRVSCEDRDNPGHYVNIAFFDSYESAIQNSGLPATQEFAKKLMALVDGPMKFYNLDVLDDRT
jgi:hypothetical protein